MKRECISLHIGQAGIQVGNACWKLYCLEHGIQDDGKIVADPLYSSGLSTLFSINSAGKHVPRAVFVDAEPTVMDDLRTGPYSKLFNPEQFISGEEHDPTKNFARGRYTVGMGIVDRCLERIRRLANDCDNLQGFIVYNAVGGGTGSGLGSLLLEKLSVAYDKKTKLGFNVYPSPQVSTSDVEPYNSVFFTRSLMEHTDVSVLLDNEAIYDICRRSLSIERPTYTNLNCLISHVISSLTANLEGSVGPVTASLGAQGWPLAEAFSIEYYPLNFHLSDFQTNLVTYPRTHFMLSSYAPVISAEKALHARPSILEITNRVFEPASMMAKCDPRKGRYTACCLMYTGIKPNDLAGVHYMKTRPISRFVDWSGIKSGGNPRARANMPGDDFAKMDSAVSMISNSTSIAEVFSNITQKFDHLFETRDFVHQYVNEGMDEEEFLEARQDLVVLQKDYEEIYWGEVM